MLALGRTVGFESGFPFYMLIATLKPTLRACIISIYQMRKLGLTKAKEPAKITQSVKKIERFGRDVPEYKVQVLS